MPPETPNPEGAAYFERLYEGLKHGFDRGKFGPYTTTWNDATERLVVTHTRDNTPAPSAVTNAFNTLATRFIETNAPESLLLYAGNMRHGIFNLTANTQEMRSELSRFADTLRRHSTVGTNGAREIGQEVLTVLNDAMPKAQIIQR